jgi:hypothetical protein
MSIDRPRFGAVKTLRNGLLIASQLLTLTGCAEQAVIATPEPITVPASPRPTKLPELAQVATATATRGVETSTPTAGPLVRRTIVIEPTATSTSTATPAPTETPTATVEKGMEIKTLTPAEETQLIKDAKNALDNGIARRTNGDYRLGDILIPSGVTKAVFGQNHEKGWIGYLMTKGEITGAIGVIQSIVRTSDDRLYLVVTNPPKEQLKYKVIFALGDTRIQQAVEGAKKDEYTVVKKGVAKLDTVSALETGEEVWVYGNWYGETNRRDKYGVPNALDIVISRPINIAK